MGGEGGVGDQEHQTLQPCLARGGGETGLHRKPLGYQTGIEKVSAVK
jgi:hypothetical protein